MARICGAEFGPDYIRYVILEDDGSLLCHSTRNDPEGKFPFGSAVWLTKQYDDTPFRLASTGIGPWPQKKEILQIPNRHIAMDEALLRGQKAEADFSMPEKELYVPALGAALCILAE